MEKLDLETANRLSVAIKDGRESAGLSQTQLADLVGCGPQFICDIEAGRKAPGTSNLTKIAKALNLSLDNIFLT